MGKPLSMVNALAKVFSTKLYFCFGLGFLFHFLYSSWHIILSLTIISELTNLVPKICFDFCNCSTHFLLTVIDFWNIGKIIKIWINSHCLSQLFMGICEQSAFSFPKQIKPLSLTWWIQTKGSIHDCWEFVRSLHLSFSCYSCTLQIAQVDRICITYSFLLSEINVSEYKCYLIYEFDPDLIICFPVFHMKMVIFRQGVTCPARTAKAEI